MNFYVFWSKLFVWLVQKVLSKKLKTNTFLAKVLPQKGSLNLLQTSIFECLLSPEQLWWHNFAIVDSIFGKCRLHTQISYLFAFRLRTNGFSTFSCNFHFPQLPKAWTTCKNTSFRRLFDCFSTFPRLTHRWNLVQELVLHLNRLLTGV